MKGSFLKDLIMQSTGRAYENHVPLFLSSRDLVAAVGRLSSAFLYGKVSVTSDLDQAHRYLVFALMGKIVQVVDLAYLDVANSSAFVPFQNSFDVLFDEVYLTENITGTSNLVTVEVPATITTPYSNFTVKWIRNEANAEFTFAWWAVDPNGFEPSPVGSLLWNDLAVTEKALTTDITKYINTRTSSSRFPRGSLYYKVGSGALTMASNGSVIPTADLTEGTVIQYWHICTALYGAAPHNFRIVNGTTVESIELLTYGLNRALPLSGTEQMVSAGTYKMRLAAREGTVTVRYQTANIAAILLDEEHTLIDGYFTTVVPRTVPEETSALIRMIITYTAPIPAGLKPILVTNIGAVPISFVTNGGAMTTLASGASETVLFSANTEIYIETTGQWFGFNCYNGGVATGTVYSGGLYYPSTFTISDNSTFDELKIDSYA